MTNLFITIIFVEVQTVRIDEQLLHYVEDTVQVKQVGWQG